VLFLRQKLKRGYYGELPKLLIFDSILKNIILNLFEHIILINEKFQNVLVTKIDHKEENDQNVSLKR